MAWMAKDGSQVWHLDLSSRVINKSTRRVWTLHDFKEPNKEGALSEILLLEFDCEDDRFRHLQSTSYKGNNGSGPVMDSINTPSDWAYVHYKGSISWALALKTCDRPFTP